MNFKGLSVFVLAPPAAKMSTSPALPASTIPASPDAGVKSADPAVKRAAAPHIDDLKRLYNSIRHTTDVSQQKAMAINLVSNLQVHLRHYRETLKTKCLAQDSEFKMEPWDTTTQITVPGVFEVLDNLRQGHVRNHMYQCLDLDSALKYLSEVIEAAKTDGPLMDLSKPLDAKNDPRHAPYKNYMPKRVRHAALPKPKAEVKASTAKARVQAIAAQTVRASADPYASAKSTITAPKFKICRFHRPRTTRPQTASAIVLPSNVLQCAVSKGSNGYVKKYRCKTSKRRGRR